MDLQIQRIQQLMKEDFVTNLTSYLENPQGFNSNIYDPRTDSWVDISRLNSRTDATYRLVDRFLHQGISTKEQYQKEMEAMMNFYAQKSSVALTNPSVGDNRFLNQRQKEFLIRLCIASIVDYVGQYSQTNRIDLGDPNRVLAIKQKIEQDLQRLLPVPRSTITDLLHSLSTFEQQVNAFSEQTHGNVMYNMRVLNAYRALGRAPPLLNQVLSTSELGGMIERMALYDREYVPPSYSTGRRRSLGTL